MDAENIGGACMNVLEELYHGNVRPNDKQFDRTSQFARFCEILTENERHLTAFLTALPNAENELHLLSQMVNAQAEVSGHSEMERFIEGFRLGARFMMDTFVMPDNSLIRDII